MARLIFTKDTAHAKSLSQKMSTEGLKRIRRGIYTDAPFEQINDLVASKWYEIVNYLYPSAIVSHSSAVNLRPIHGVIYISAPVKQRKKINIADSLTIDVLPGNVNRLIEPFVPCLFRSSAARYL